MTSRRKFIKTAGLAGIAGAAVPMACANETEDEKIKFDSLRFLKKVFGLNDGQALFFQF